MGEGPGATTGYAVIAHPLELNLWSLNRDFARIPGAIVHDDPDLLWYCVPATNSWLNGASRCDLGADAEAVIRKAVKVWHELGVAAMWHQTPTSSPSGLAEILARVGFTPDVQPGMAMALDRRLEDPPPDLVIGAVSDEAGVLEWVNTFDLAIGVEPRGDRHPWLAAFAALYLGDAAPGRLIVGHVDGVAVATSLAFVGAGAVGIYGVGTIPERRGRGYGGALTVAGVEWGRSRGASLAVLEATGLGLPVYRRLGFATVFETTSWIRPADTVSQDKRTAVDQGASISWLVASRRSLPRQRRS